MGFIIFHIIFLDILHIQSEYEEYLEIFHGILSIPHNIVVNLNNIMNHFCDHIYIYILTPSIKGHFYNVNRNLH